MSLFETAKTNAGTQPKNELQQGDSVWQLLLWCLLRNCEETAAKPPLPPKTAIYRRIFLQFLAELCISELFTLNSFGWLVRYLKYQMQKCWSNFLEKNKMIPKCLIQREIMGRNNKGCFAVVSSQFHIFYAYDSWPWKSLMRAITSYRHFLK